MSSTSESLGVTSESITKTISAIQECLNIRPKRNEGKMRRPVNRFQPSFPSRAPNRRDLYARQSTVWTV